MQSEEMSRDSPPMAKEMASSAAVKHSQAMAQPRMESMQMQGMPMQMPGMGMP